MDKDLLIMYLKKSMILAILGSITLVMYVVYLFTTEPFTKLLMVFTFFSFIVPISLKSLVFLASVEQCSSRRNKYKQKNANARVVNTPYYSECRDKIKYLMQEQKLDREELLLFKQELNKMLGQSKEVYKKIKYENDMHEIYIKLKSKRLTSEKYITLIDYLNTLTDNKELYTFDNVKFVDFRKNKLS